MPVNPDQVTKTICLRKNVESGARGLTEGFVGIVGGRLLRRCLVWEGDKQCTVSCAIPTDIIAGPQELEDRKRGREAARQQHRQEQLQCEARQRDSEVVTTILETPQTKSAPQEVTFVQDMAPQSQEITFYTRPKEHCLREAPTTQENPGQEVVLTATMPGTLLESVLPLGDAIA